MITDLRINAKGELEGKVIPPARWEEMYTKDAVIAMLTDIQLEIEEKEYLDGEEPINITQDYIDEVKSWEYGKKDCYKIIQQKIDALKEQTDGNNDN